MLPSFTSVTGFSGSVRSAFSSRTSQIRLALAADMVIMTKIMESIIRLMRMFMQ